MSRSVGCGVAGAGSWPLFSRSTPITLRSSSSAWRAVARRRAAVSCTSVGGQVRPDFESTGVQRHQGDPVREDVVHLTCDAGPFGQPGLLLVQFLVGFGAERSLAQRQQQLPAGPDEHAPPAGGQRQRHDEQHDGGGTGRRAVDGVGQNPGDPQQGPPRADRAGDARRGRRAPAGRRRSPTSRRSPTTHTRSRRRAASVSATTERGRPAPRSRCRRPPGRSAAGRGVPQGRAQEQRSQSHGKRESKCVDGPFAWSAAVGSGAGRSSDAAAGPPARPRTSATGTRGHRSPSAAGGHRRKSGVHAERRIPGAVSHFRHIVVVSRPMRQCGK